MATDDTDGAMDVDPSIEGEDPQIIAQKIINEEYKVWKKNAHYLYDLFYSRVLDWPSLTAQWFPDKKVLEDEDKSVHRLLLGTHTDDPSKQNYVQIAQFDMPLGLRPDPEDYNPETEEIGGHGAAKKGMPLAKFNVTQKIPHDGEVNKARYMPHNPDLIATMTNSGKACVFDRTKHPSQPGPTAHVNPQIELVGHTDEGFALNWNPGKEGELATGSNDTTVKLWDITGYQKSSKTLKPVRTFTHHSAVVNDVEFHPALNWMIATVSDDLSLQILDTRKDTNSTAAKCVQQAHTDAVNAVSFNHASEYILATGSADKSIAIWDLRMLKMKLHALEGHQDVVTRIEWNPVEKQKHVLASAGHDRRIIMWDLSAVGNEQTPEDAEDGPPELMFIHGGHTNHIADFSFNRNEPYLLCSAAEDNLVHVWHPNDACLYGTENEDVSIEELERHSGIQPTQKEGPADEEVKSAAAALSHMRSDSKTSTAGPPPPTTGFFSARRGSQLEAGNTMLDLAQSSQRAASSDSEATDVDSVVEAASSLVTMKRSAMETKSNTGDRSRMPLTDLARAADDAQR